MNTDYNDPAWLARNCDESIPFEMACRTQIKRLMAKNAELEQQLEAVGAGGVSALMPRNHVAHDLKMVAKARDEGRPTAWLITDRADRLGGFEWITRSELDMKEALEEGCQVEPLWAEQRIATPAGWRLVPLAPTKEMVAAAQAHHEGSAYLPFSLYHSMLEAAPKAEIPAQQHQDEHQREARKNNGLQVKIAESSTSRNQPCSMGRTGPKKG